MKARPFGVICLLIVACAPLWAWRTAGEPEELSKHYQAAVTQAMTEAEKCLASQPPDVNQARFLLLAVSDLCVPSGGHDAKVPEDMLAAYKALCPKAWATDVPDEAAFTATVKQYTPKFEKAYINAFYIADCASTYRVSEIAREFAKAEALRPAALALCIEFAGKSIPPEAYQKYFFQGDKGSDLVQIHRVMANVLGGPDAIRQVSQETFVPNALEEAQRILDDVAQLDDPDEIRLKAGWVQEQLNFVFWADPENVQGKELAAKNQAMRDKAKAIYAAEIKSNRVPPDRYGGGDAATLKEGMKKVFMFEAPHTIVRVTIPGTQWVEKPHVWTGYNAVDVGWYKQIDGAVVIKLTGDGTCWVHPVTFGRRWTGEGDNYGDLVVYGWADRYQILPEFVNK